MASIWASVLLLLVSIVHITMARTYFVIPARNGAPCPATASCHKLSYYTSQPHEYFTSNTILYFLEGTHEFNINGRLVIENVENLTLQGLGGMVSGFDETVSQTNVVINCSNPITDIGNSGLAILYSRNITIQNLTFTRCGHFGMYSPQLLHYFLPLFNYTSFVAPMLRTNMSVVMIEVTNATIEYVSIQNSTGFGLVVVNGYTITISYNSFAYNNYYTLDSPCTNCFGGNIALLYTNQRDAYNSLSTCPTPMNYELIISHSNFSFGVNIDHSGSRLYVGRGLGYTAGGLFIGMEQRLYGVDVVLDTVVAHGNIGLLGANIVFEVYEGVTYYTLTIRNVVSKFSNRISSISVNVVHNVSEGGGLYTATGIASFLILPRCSNPQSQAGSEIPITIYNSNFTDNFAARSAGMSLNAYGVTSILQQIVIDSCHVTDNVASALCIGLCISTPNIGSGTPINFLLRNVAVSRNKARQNFLLQNTSSMNSNLVAMQLLTVFNCTVSGITVTDNEGTGILMADSGLQFLGLSSNLLSNNSGENGGGIAMYGSSFLFLFPSSKIRFHNNHANEFGGALYIDQTGVSETFCFYQMILNFTEFLRESSLGTGKVFVFSNNTAGVAGTVLFGGSIESCLILPNSIISNVITAFREHENLQNGDTNGLYFFQAVLTEFENQIGNSVISSAPLRVCFCSGNNPECLINQLNLTVFPGQSIQIPFVTLGQTEGAAPGVLLVEELTENRLISSTLNATSPQCSTLAYAVKENSGNSTILRLSINRQQQVNFQQSATVSVVVSLSDCPSGFELDQMRGVCDCSEQLITSIQNVTCNVTNLDITRLGNVWIGTDVSESCLLVDSSCPFDYCNSGLVSLNINDTDSQCAFNRSGLLCGQCSSGLSVLLGSNACGVCSNDFLALLIPFALAGLLLTVIIILLNLTVSVGTINGLIFYANVVKLAEAVYFPNGPIPVLSQFISWLNLDLGIQVCFYQGMDSYAKIWLQFVFPSYIWLIVIVFAIIAHYSTVFSKMMGNNAISVLATLILLSYMKLFRTISQALLGGLYACGTSTQFLWIVDANVPYFQSKHLALGIFVLLVLLLLVIPYTLILLFSPLVESAMGSQTCFRKIYLFSRPFLDAYGGIYKDNYRFWTGFLMLCRILLLLVISFSDNNSVIILTIIVTVSVILTLSMWLKGVYQSHYLNMLESWFFLNLIILSACAASEHSETGVFISVNLVLLTFIGILCFHFYEKVKNHRNVKSLIDRVLRRSASEIDYNGIQDADRPDILVNNSARAGRTTSVQLRESLLSS